MPRRKLSPEVTPPPAFQISAAAEEKERQLRHEFNGLFRNKAIESMRRRAGETLDSSDVETAYRDLVAQKRENWRDWLTKGFGSFIVLVGSTFWGYGVRLITATPSELRPGMALISAGLLLAVLDPLT
jgi:hypothetical protein